MVLETSRFNEAAELFRGKRVCSITLWANRPRFNEAAELFRGKLRGHT